VNHDSKWLVLVSLGADFRLLQVHSNALARDGSGFAVLTVGDLEGAMSILAQRKVDGAIVCHSYSEEDRIVILKAFHTADPRMPVLLLAPEDDDPAQLGAHARHLFNPVRAEQAA
jgi:DNA-binding NtrC family response regulator